MVMFMRNVMVKTKILTKQLQSVDVNVVDTLEAAEAAIATLCLHCVLQLQSVDINVVDTLEAAEATIATLCHLRNDEENLNRQIDAAIIFSHRIGIDAIEEYQRHHRPRRQPRRIDEQTETEAHLDLNEYYRKEFVQILDHQITALSDNVKVAFDIISSCISLLLPPYKEDPKREDIESLTELLPLSLQPDTEVLNVELTMF